LRGGILMLAGSSLGLMGGLLAPYGTVSGGEIISMGPSWGLALAFLASFIVLSGLWVQEPQLALRPERRASRDESGPTLADNFDALRGYVDAASRQGAALEESESRRANGGVRAQPQHEAKPTSDELGARTARPQRFCTRCGSALTAGMSFCPDCGTRPALVGGPS
jgi:hypothetical protein